MHGNNPGSGGRRPVKGTVHASSERKDDTVSGSGADDMQNQLRFNGYETPETSLSLNRRDIIRGKVAIIQLASVCQPAIPEQSPLFRQQ